MVPFPPECQPKLVIDPQAVAASHPAAERLQPVARGACQIDKVLSGIEHLQLAAGDRPDDCREPAGVARVPLREEIGRRLIRERLDHALHDTRVTMNSQGRRCASPDGGLAYPYACGSPRARSLYFRSSS